MAANVLESTVAFATKSLARKELSELLLCDLFQVEEGNEFWKEEMYSALKSLLKVLLDDSSVSSFELQTSGLVAALLNCLNKVQYANVLCAMGSVGGGRGRSRGGIKRRYSTYCIGMERVKSATFSIIALFASPPICSYFEHSTCLLLVVHLLFFFVVSFFSFHFRVRKEY